MEPGRSSTLARRDDPAPSAMSTVPEDERACKRGGRSERCHMEPLDLTKAPPRPARAKLLGVMFLPRTVDKLRAELPGGTMGPYLNHDRGFSAYVVRRLGLDMDELRRIVGEAREEEEIVAWLRDRIDVKSVDETNRKLESFTSERMTPDDRALLVERHPVLHERPELTSILDILDAEDARAGTGGG